MKADSSFSEDKFVLADLSSAHLTGEHAFSVDVEEWFQVGAFETTFSKNDWVDLESRVVLQTTKVLDLLKEHTVTATFFCLGSVAKHFPEIIAAIAEAGHEVACHGMAHQRIFTMTRDEFQQELGQSKLLLEKASGQKVIGYRAPSFSLTPEVWWVYEDLKAAGFIYSSSLYPVETDHYGLANAPRQPFYPEGVKGVLEIPMTVCDTALKRFPASGGGYFRLLPYILSEYLMRNGSKQSKSPGIFYMHPWEMDTGQPYVAEAPLLSRFRHYQGQAKLPQKLSKLLTKLQWNSFENIYAELLQER